MKRFSFIFLILIFCLPLFAKQPQKGYRGFLDWSNSIKNYDLPPLGRVTDYYTGVSTTHGYQINSWVFAGVGIDYEYYSDAGLHILAPYFDCRSDMKFGKFTPFADVRIGYNYSDGLDITAEKGGLYFSPSIGYRFNWGWKIGVNVGVGITLKGRKLDVIEIVPLPDNGWWGNKIGEKTNYQTFFSFRVGFDF